MGIEEVGVGTLASAPLRAEDAHKSATLHRRPRLEISDEGRDQRQLSEGASLGRRPGGPPGHAERGARDRKSTRLNSSHSQISYAVFCLKKKKKNKTKLSTE